ncbi:hypothetical protein EDB19DRAFT_1839907, partial [Suillus lakei]
MLGLLFLSAVALYDPTPRIVLSLTEGSKDCHSSWVRYQEIYIQPSSALADGGSFIGVSSAKKISNVTGTSHVSRSSISLDIVMLREAHTSRIPPTMPRCTRSNSCQYAANDQRLLDNHIRETHLERASIGGIEVRRLDDKLFHCPTCDTASSDPRTVQNHYNREHAQKKKKTRDPPEATPPVEDEPTPPVPKKRKKKAKDTSATQTPDLPPTPSREAAISALQRISIIVDPLYKIAICIDCGVAVPAQHVRTHAVKHTFKAPPKQELDLILASLDCVSEFARPSSEAIAPIVGLKLLEGLACKMDGCDYLAAANNTLIDHFNRQHPNTPWRPNSTACTVQRVFEFRGAQTLVLVDLNQVSSYHCEYVDYLAKIGKNRPPADDDLYHVESDTRKHGTFLAKMGWNKAIEGRSLAALLQATSAPGDDEEHLQSLHTAAHQWLTSICAILPHLDVTFLRWINTSKGDIVNAPFRAPVTDTYAGKCARIWGRFLMMFLRYLDHPDTFPLELHLSEHQTLSLHELLSTLRGGGSGSAVDKIQEVSFIFLATPNGHITQDRFSCSLIQYIIMSHLLLDGTFDPPSNVVPNLSCIQFCMRAAAVLQAYNHCIASGESNGSMLDYYFSDLSELLTEGSRYPFTTLREEMHQLSAMAHSETRLPCLLWNEDHTVLQVDGSPLIISSIRDMVKALLCHADQLIIKLCEGADMSAFDQCLKKHLNLKDPSLWPKDPLRNQTPRYSFVTDPDNPFQALQVCLLAHFGSDMDMFQKFHVVNKNGEIIFKQASWFTVLAQLHDVAFCLVHVTSGGPARGTELETYRLINTRESPRTLYFVSGHVAFITGYNKSRQRTNYPDRFVARPIYPPLQRVIMYLAGPLHHVADYWVHAIDKKFPALGPEVFTHFGKPLHSEDFSGIIRNHTAEHLHVPMGLRMWRQMMKALMRRVVNVDIDDDGDQEEDALDEVFGHTTGTGSGWMNQQPISRVTPLSLRTTPLSLRTTPLSLRTTPRSLRVTPLQPEDNAPQPDISFAKIHKAMSATLAGLQQSASIHTAAIKETASSNALIIEILQTTNDKIDRAHQTVLQAQGGAGQGSRSFIQDVEPLEIASNRIQGLRLYLQDSSASFKSIQQALAIEVISRGFPHVLIVMPTGAGKSAIYASPGYAETAGFRLVIIPYRSLLDQATQDARSKGLPYSVYPSQDMDVFHSRLVFAALEHCAHNDFRTWCKAAKDANLLRGIFFDEVHDVLIAAEYRHAFKQMFKLTDMNVQVALITGTLSPGSEMALLQ